MLTFSVARSLVIGVIPGSFFRCLCIVCFPLFFFRSLSKGEIERHFQKEKQSIAERWRSQRLCADLWMQPSQFGLTLPMFVCVFLCASVCVGVWLCACTRCSVCVQTSLINAAPPSGAMWLEWLVSTSWTLLTPSLLVLQRLFSQVRILWEEILLQNRLLTIYIYIYSSLLLCEYDCSSMPNLPGTHTSSSVWGVREMLQNVVCTVVFNCTESKGWSGVGRVTAIY